MNLTEIYNTNKIFIFKRSLYPRRIKRSNGSVVYCIRNRVSRFPYFFMKDVMGIVRDDLYNIAVEKYNGIVTEKRDFLCFHTEEECNEFIEYIKGLQVKGV